MVTPRSTPVDSHAKYAQMSLVELAERIATEHDQQALKELHDNRVLCHRRGEVSLRLVEYIQVLSQGSLARRWCGGDDLVLAVAYDLTVDKFSRIPDDVTGDPAHGSEGPDCCNYYRAFIAHVTTKLKANPPANSIQAEMLATGSLRALVARHFYLSCLESRRRAQKFVRRYVWRIDGRVLYVWLPVELRGDRCRRWLETYVPDVEPGRPGEQERVQGIVNRLLGRPRVISAEEMHSTTNITPAQMDPVGAMIEEDISDKGLTQVIAEEKAENIEHQRPAIRQLGRDKLRSLIQEVFDSLVQGNYRADKIALRFGLSEATFSRFAGSRWKEDGAEPVRASVPDLWRNTAQTLARHPDFVAAAKLAGVWKRVTDVLNMPEAGGRSRDG